MSWWSLSTYSAWLRPLPRRAARRWLISALRVGELAPIAYSRCARTRAEYRGIRADVEYVQKMIERPGIAIVSLQCTVKVEVVSGLWLRRPGDVRGEVFEGRGVLTTFEGG